MGRSAAAPLPDAGGDSPLQQAQDLRGGRREERVTSRMTLAVPMHLLCGAAAISVSIA